MEAKGIIRNCDNLGRVVIPKELRKTFGIGEGEQVEILPQENGILLRKYIPSHDIKAKIENVIFNIEEIADYKEIEHEDMQKIKDYLGLALSEYEKLNVDARV